MENKTIKVGIISGSGLGDSIHNVFKYSSTTKREDAKNDFGYPSSDLYHGCIEGVDVVLLSRHGVGHKLSPTAVNYRANIEALKLTGCTHVLASNACGSLTEAIGRGQLIIPDSFIDRTSSRKSTFYDETSTKYSGVCHIPMEPAFDPRTSEILLEAARKLGYNVTKGGTIVIIEGPRFSTKAESKVYRAWGGHLIGMTTYPEVCLAKEAGLLYASIAMATDYDCWKDCDNVHAADVVVIFKQNVDKVIKLLIEAVKLIGTEDWDQDIHKLKNLIESSNVSVKC